MKLPLFLTLLAVLPLAALKQPAPPTESETLAAKTKQRLKPMDANVISTIPELQGRAMATKNPALTRMIAAWSNAQQVMGPNTIVYLDQRTGGPSGVQPDGLPWIPGTGMNNRLTRADMAPYASLVKASDNGRDPPDANGVNNAVLERIARNFMTAHPEWFPVPQNQLQFDPTELDPNHYVRMANFNQVVNGVQVEGARLIFSLNHGNLVSYGGQFLAPVTLATTPAVTEAGAIANALSYAGVVRESLSGTPTARLRIVIDEDGGAVPGGGYSHRLVFAVTFLHPGQFGTWEAEVDARTGDVVGFRDTNEHGQIAGGVQPLSNDGICPTGCEQASWPMPYAEYTNVACGVTIPTLANSTDAGGNYPNSYAGTLNTKLCGPYVRMNDACGAISATGTVPNNMNFGVSGGTDCVVPAPNIGGAGNTHAARTAFYNVNKLKEQVRGWRPTFTFNNARVQVNTNVNNTCNATYSGQLNMYRDNGSACRNTGEIAMIFDHEMGHGYDGAESGNSRPGEAFADDVASLLHHDACIGRGFFKAQTCGGYGDPCVTCTGVRGSDWTGHRGSGTLTAPVPLPHTVANITTANPSGFICPTTGTLDICNRETHCVAYPITESVWDAVNIDLPHNPIPAGGGAACAGTNPGNPIPISQAWNLMSKLFWLSAPSGGDQFSCVTNGTAGCGAATLFRIIKVQDDLDGNLTNGTPHAAELQCAFARHQTGCTTDTNTDQMTCPAIGTPTVTTIPGNGTVQLNWGTVAGVNTWRVMRNEEGCGSGYTVLASLAAGTLTYTDANLQTGRTYFYQVQAVGVNAACEGAPSACVTEKPAAYTTPTLTSATPTAANQITLAFTTGATPAPRFKVYRDRSTCAAANFNFIGNFNPAPLATGITASPYVDNGVTGAGLTYAYVVSGSAIDGLLETDRSNCLEVTPTGVCSLLPTFAGATTALNSPGSTCTVNLSWSAGSAICGNGSITYNIYRSTVTPFTPAAGNRIATGVSGTTYSDASSLTYNTTYYYIVRAVDSVGNEDTNIIKVNDRPTGTITTHYSTDFESGANGWAHDAVNSTATTGNWLVADPIETPYQPGDDHTPPAGVNCFFTAQNPGGAAGTDDVDGGTSTGQSGVINASAAPILTSGVLEFWYFTSSNVAADDAGDFFRVDLSGNSGTTYPVNLILRGDTAPSPVWTKYSNSLPALMAPTATMRLRIQAADGIAAGDVEEGGIDDVRIYSSASCTACTAAPAMSTVTGAKSGTNLVQNWTLVAGASTYRVYRETNANVATWVSPAVATGLTGATWADTNQLSNNTTQFYSVTDVNSCGAESPK